MAAPVMKFSGLQTLLICFLVWHLGDADRIKSRIYVKFDGIGACFRRFNATHQTGCTSSRSGNVGVVHLINSTADRDWLLSNGTHPPYVAVMASTRFTRPLVESLVSSGKINGIIVLDYNLSLPQTVVPDAFSADLACPNDKYGLYAGDAEYSDCQKVKWNEPGNGLLFEDFNFPIYSMTNNTEIDFLINKCYVPFNLPGPDGASRDFPLCAAELRDVMDGAKDSVTCMRRSTHITNLNPDKYCDPLGDRNVYSTYKHVDRSETRPDKSVLVAAARLDASSMFANSYSGADTAVSGFVALLGAAEALSDVKYDFSEPASKDVMFLFLQGEAYDYIGSSRLAYDMRHGRFPQSLPADWAGVAQINASHTQHFIEVNQVGLLDTDSLWMHTDPLSLQDTDVSPQITELVTSLHAAAKEAGLQLSRAPPSQPLPPASLQSFLKHHPLSGLVITDHQGRYTNTHYNSRFDTARRISVQYPPDLPINQRENYVTEQAKRLTKVSSTLAKALYKMATGKNSTNVAAKEKFVTQLLYCYLLSPRCNLFRTVVDVKNKKALEKSRAPYPLYVGVDYVKNVVTTLTDHLLSFLVGDILINSTSDDCRTPDKNHSYTYIWMAGPLNTSGHRNPMCVRSLANYSLAVSPAFLIDGYDMLSGEYSTWTESIWPEDAMSVRVFLIPSQAQKTTVLSVGVILFLALSLLIYFITARAGILFPSTAQEYL